MEDNSCREIRRRRDARRWTLRSRAKFPLGLTKFVFQTALCILSLSNLDFDCCMHWLFRKKRRGAPAPATLSHCIARETFQALLLNTHTGLIASWSSRHETPYPSALRAATKICREWKLEQLVLRENTLKGASVSSAEIVDRFVEFDNENNAFGAVLGGIDALSSPVTKRSWARRWRKRNRLRIGKLKTGEPMNLDVKRRKVSPQHTPGGRGPYWPQGPSPELPKTQIEPRFPTNTPNPPGGLIFGARPAAKVKLLVILAPQRPRFGYHPAGPPFGCWRNYGAQKSMEF